MVKLLMIHKITIKLENIKNFIAVKGKAGCGL